MKRMMMACLASSRVLVADSFDRSNSTTSIGNADSGQTWTNSAVDANALGISGNAAYNSAATMATAVIDSGTATVDISIVVRTFADYMGFVFRFTDSNNYCLGEFQNATHKFVVFGKASGSAFGGTSVAGYYIASMPTFANGDTLRIVVSGTTVTLYINGTSSGSLTITQNASATKHGIKIYNTTARINSFMVKRP